MDISKQLISIPKMEELSEIDWMHLEEQTLGIMDQKSTFINSFRYQNMNNFSEYDYELVNPCSYANPSDTHFEFNALENFGDDIFRWDANVPSFFPDYSMDPMLINTSFDTYNCNFDNMGNAANVFPLSTNDQGVKIVKQSGRSKSPILELEEIQQYFDVPITKAAKELNVGLTVLKKRCRELNIMRWPHRKIKSVRSLIKNVKELGLTAEIAMLEEHQRMLKKIPELELTERTKKLRQACFKANYKRRRSGLY